LEYEKDANYGNFDYPAWSHGYYLAKKTRQILDLGDSPIQSLRTLCYRIGVPLVQVELPEHFAGATIQTGNARGIVVNIRGFNDNVWTRRATIAHELGHMIWDPEEFLERVRVDDYDDIQTVDSRQLGRVEARANAFAIELLAPASGVQAIVSRRPSAQNVRDVMLTFGISLTAARYHIWNTLERRVDIQSLVAPDSNPTDDWKGRESFTVDWFPLSETPVTRRGHFAALVVSAERKGFISVETATTYLSTTQDRYLDNSQSILELFGS
jgi:hypothetical protein